MKTKLCVGVAVIALASMAQAQQVRNVPRLRDVRVQARVSETGGGGSLSYQYQVENGASSDAGIHRWFLDVSRAADSSDLSADGLLVSLKTRVIPFTQEVAERDLIGGNYPVPHIW